MDYHSLNAFSSAVMSFATVLGVMFAIIYYLSSIIKMDFLEIFLIAIIYIVLILSYLYILKNAYKDEKEE